MGSSTWPRESDYRCTWCQGTAHPLDSRPQREVHPTWQAEGGSILLLPRRHALSSRWLWTFNHNMCENRLVEVQGIATSSLFLPSLFQDMWPCVQLLCAERNAPCQWDLAIDKANLQHLQRNDRAMIRQMSSRKTLSPPDPMSYLRSLALRIWTSFWRREGSVGMDMLNAPMVQWRQLAFDIQVDGKCGPRRPKMTWK